MPEFSQRVNWIAGEGAAAWDLHFAAMQASQSDPEVIVLSVGDPEFSTPKHIVDVAVDALRGGDTHYAPVRGRENLRAAIAKECMRLGGPAMDADNIAVLAGTQNALFTASLCLLSPGDEVISLDPMYVTYEAFLGVSGATLKRVPCNADNGFRLDVDRLQKAVTPWTKAIAFSNPNNPTGVVMSRQEVEAIADIAKRNDLWVMADEVYASQNFENPHVSIAALEGMAERTVTVSSLSKSHAMTGFRVGWLAGPKALADHAENLALCMIYGLPGFIQQAALEALENGHSEADRMRDIYKRRRDLVIECLKDCEALTVLKPQSGMFVLVDVRQTGLSAIEFSKRLYADEKVSVLDGAAFGPNAAGFVRVSFTNDDDILVEACKRIVRFADKVV